MDENNISEERSYHQNSAEVIDHTCDYNGNHFINTEEESDIISIHSTNETNDIYMTDYDHFIHKLYAPSYHQRIM